MTRRPMSARRARAVVVQARLVKAPDWSDTRAWHVVADDVVLVVVSPSYGGTSRSGRNKWQWRLADAAIPGSRPEPTREQAAAAGLAAWERWVTSKENR
ncbi:hypothetical protein JL475_00440 [Streptomyces sp. M2CJ-2]|uniref:hypothetical protein n=1 Tax=Streptomyces sp. M2CJ-2 TaxID=2803948 RepID=UPI00192164FA|nr:hypothetical protein [Streptomyces sp. M2CJ-2]MBL3664514.1 hypothetical protein [Streptomyces sp. M2CJ-2]